MCHLHWYVPGYVYWYLKSDQTGHQLLQTKDIPELGRKSALKTSTATSLRQFELVNVHDYNYVGNYLLRY
jgi:hypothetical protein